MKMLSIRIILQDIVLSFAYINDQYKKTKMELKKSDKEKIKINANKHIFTGFFRSLFYCTIREHIFE